MTVGVVCGVEHSMQMARVTKISMSMVSWSPQTWSELRIKSLVHVTFLTCKLKAVILFNHIIHAVTAMELLKTV